MKSETKYDLDQKVETPTQGKGRIEMIGITESGTRYLVVLDGQAGKCWCSEDELDKANAKKAPAAKVALIILAFLLALFFAVPARAQHVNASDGYVTAVATTNTTLSEVVFSGAPTKLIRLLSVNYESESAGANLVMYAGTVPYGVTGVINTTNLTVTSNAGIPTNRLVILQYGGTNWTATVLMTNQLTNVVLAGGSGLGFTPLTNSVLWMCGLLTQEEISISRGTKSGEALFSGVVRGPLAVRVDPAIASSNRLSATVKYSDPSVATAAP